MPLIKDLNPVCAFCAYHEAIGDQCYVSKATKIIGIPGEKVFPACDACITLFKIEAKSNGWGKVKEKK